MDVDNINNFLKKLRLQSGFKTQKDLSEASGVSQTTLSRIEAGTQKPKPETLRTLSKHFTGVDYLELMEKAGYVTQDMSEHLTPSMKTLLEDDNSDIETLLNKYIDLYVSMHTGSDGLISKEFLEHLARITNAEDLLTPENDDPRFQDPEFWKETLKSMGMDFKTFFLNFHIEMLKDSEIEGYVGYRKHRSWELDHFNETGDFPVDKLSSIPLHIMHKISANLPIFSREHIEEESTFPNFWSLEMGRAFVLNVKDDSMKGARINVGDRVVVRIQVDYESGDIIVANVNEMNATIKRLKKIKGGQSWLVQENSNYDPSLIDNAKVRMVGKVVGVISDI